MLSNVLNPVQFDIMNSVITSEFIKAMRKYHLMWTYACGLMGVTGRIKFKRKPNAAVEFYSAKCHC
jgi:hypothetical protein